MSLIDRLEKFAGIKLKPGRNLIKGYPVDLKDNPDEDYLDLEAVDQDACTGLVKALRAAKFKAKRDSDKGISISEGIEILSDLLEESAKLPDKASEKKKTLKEWVENKDFDKLWEKYVPGEGEAKTMFGEAVRSLGRLEYDYYNNGFGNAYDSFDDGSNRYGDDKPSYTWEPREYYADMGKHLVKFLKSKQARADVISAANFVAPSRGGAKPWDDKPDPRFKKSIETLKNWFVENEKEHA